jgi:pyridoxamine 5'-phosphate oxidase
VADPATGDLAYLANLRRVYGLRGLDERDVAPTWLEQFGRWFAEAELREANAMVLATADSSGRPSARMLLLKGVSERGFVFYTNCRSRKAGELRDNTAASLLFPWAQLERQVRVEGRVEPVTPEETVSYWASRPRGARLGAWASRQSQVIPSRKVLEDRFAELDGRWPDEVPLPPFWGGYRLVPDSVEFWQGRPDRLHDRLRYRKDPRGWVVERLAP